MTANGDGSDGTAGEALVDVVGVECTAVPFAQPIVLFVLGAGHGSEEHFISGQATDIFGRAAALAFNEAPVLHVELASTDRFEVDGVPPVVTHVFCVEWPTNTSVVER